MAKRKKGRRNGGRATKSSIVTTAPATVLCNMGDGCAAQYRTRAETLTAEERLNVWRIRRWRINIDFADKVKVHNDNDYADKVKVHHGKSACDGLGGCDKLQAKDR